MTDETEQCQLECCQVTDADIEFIEGLEPGVTNG